MLTTVWNLLTIVLVLIIIWLTRKQKVTTRLGRYNRTFMIIVAVIQIILIIVGILIMKDSISLQSASFICSLLLLISLLLDYKMHWLTAKKCHHFLGSHKKSDGTFWMEDKWPSTKIINATKSPWRQKRSSSLKHFVRLLRNDPQHWCVGWLLLRKDFIIQAFYRPTIQKLKSEERLRCCGWFSNAVSGYY